MDQKVQSNNQNKLDQNSPSNDDFEHDIDYIAKEGDPEFVGGADYRKVISSAFDKAQAKKENGGNANLTKNEEGK